MTSASYKSITLETTDEGVAVVTLNRPEAANAITTEMGEELLDVFGARAAHNRLRCLILTGAGRHFCAGGDLKERQKLDEKAWRRQHKLFEAMIEAVLDCPVPIIGAVNGAAFGGGCEISAACDFIYAARPARFALSEVRLGFMPGCGGTQTVARAVGERRSKELLITGRSFSADEAESWGLVNRVVEPDFLMEQALGTARDVATQAPLAVAAIRRAVRNGLAQPVKAALATELAEYEKLIDSEDRKEGIRAFNEKRQPHFVGR